MVVYHCLSSVVLHDVDHLQLEELGEVVEDGEDDDREDVDV